MLVFDVFGQGVVYEFGELCLYGPDPEGIQPDVVPPTVDSLSINGGEPLEVLEEGDNFQFPTTATFTDLGKGIDGLSGGYVSESGDDTVFFSANKWDLSEGNVTGGTLSWDVSISKFLEAGIYTLQFLNINDVAGNRSAVAPADAPEGVQQTLEVINPFSDLIPPELVGPVTVSPTTPDVTLNPVPVVFTFTLKDEGVGVSSGDIQVFHCSDANAQWYSGFFNSFQRIDGDEFMGTYQVTVMFDQGATSGEYGYQLRARDTAGRTKIWGKFISGRTGEAEPLPADSDESITVTSGGVEGDLTPPELTDISVVCDFDLGEGPGTMSVTLSYLDDVSPLNDFGGGFFGGNNFFRLVSPTGATIVTRDFGEFDLADGDGLSGTYTFDVPLNKALEPGDYCIQVQLTNTANLVSTYGLAIGHTPFPNDFPGIWNIVNSGPEDCSPPVPIELTITPGFTTLGEDATLDVCLRITDAGTGIQSANFQLRNGTSMQFGNRNTLFTTVLNEPDIDEKGEGTIFDATYKFEIPLTGDQFSGDFLSVRLNLTDCANNTMEWDSSICNFNFSSYPLPFHFVQIRTNGNLPPVITSNGGGDEATLDVTQNQTGVTTVTANDPDFPPDLLVFTIEGGADGALFDIDPITGVLTFKVAPTFAEGGDNDREVIVQVSDGSETDSQTITVNILELDVNDPPVIVSNGGGDTATIIVEEGAVALTTLMATDQDSGDTMVFSITGGADADLFNLSSASNVLSFKSAQAFASPADANGDNDYEVTVGVVDNGDPVLMDSQAITVRVIKIVVDENEYEACANEAGGPFPSNASAQQKAIDFDFDGDGQTNGEEFAAGTNPNDADDYFRSMVGYDPVQGFKIVFFPYFPDLNEYTLMSAFEGPNNDESTSLNISAQPFDGDPMMGCFVVPPSTGSLENLILFINTLKVSL